MLSRYVWLGGDTGPGPRVVRRKADGRCSLLWWDPRPGGARIGRVFPRNRTWGPEEDGVVEDQAVEWESEERILRRLATLQALHESMREPVERAIGRVVANADVLQGKPVIEGTRISVEQILGLLKNGLSAAEVVDQYPHLTLDDVRAALEWAQRCADEPVIGGGP